MKKSNDTYFWWGLLGKSSRRRGRQLTYELDPGDQGSPHPLPCPWDAESACFSCTQRLQLQGQTQPWAGDVVLKTPAQYTCLNPVRASLQTFKTQRLDVGTHSPCCLLRTTLLWKFPLLLKATTHPSSFQGVCLFLQSPPALSTGSYKLTGLGGNTHEMHTRSSSWWEAKPSQPVQAIWAKSDKITYAFTFWPSISGLRMCPEDTLATLPRAQIVHCSRIYNSWMLETT